MWRARRRALGGRGGESTKVNLPEIYIYIYIILYLYIYLYITNVLTFGSVAFCHMIFFMETGSPRNDVSSALSAVALSDQTSRIRAEGFQIEGADQRITSSHFVRRERSPGQNDEGFPKGGKIRAPLASVENQKAVPSMAVGYFWVFLGSKRSARVPRGSSDSRSALQLRPASEPAWA